MTVNHDGGATPGAAGDESDIRESVRELTAAALRGAPLDPKRVEDVVRRMTGAGTGAPGQEAYERPAPEDRTALLTDLAELDRALMASAEAAHETIARISARGVDYTDNDLKEAFARLRDLQHAYVGTVNRVADAATGNVQRELRGLAGHVQRVGVDAGARVAVLMSEFANRLGSTARTTASSGIDTARDYGVRMSLLASGVLAGIADGLRDQAETHQRAAPREPPAGPPSDEPSR